jgi:hypothetical protein
MLFSAFRRQRKQRFEDNDFVGIIAQRALLTFVSLQSCLNNKTELDQYNIN